MALPTNLTTNEVKDASGTEVEFLHFEAVGRSKTYAKSGEAPNLPVRLKVQHQEIGTGFKARRRSNIRVEKTSISGVDDVTPVQTIVSLTLDSPVGAVEDQTEAKAALAYLMSFFASQGGSTTILYDCTGYGAAALAGGSL